MKKVLVIAGIPVALMAVWAFRRLGNGSEESSGIPDDLDGRVLKQLVAAGSDLSKPHNVEFRWGRPLKTAAAQRQTVGRTATNSLRYTWW
jgi:hypothetical protein